MDDSEFTVLMLNRVLGTFSFVGAIFIITCYLNFADLRTFAFWLVFMVGISDLGQSIGNMLGDPSTDSLCKFQAWVVSFFGLASMFWQTAIAFTMYKAFLKEDERFNNQNIPYLKKYYLMVCWGVPALLTVCFAGTYGDAFGLCWIKPEYFYWRIVQFYLPLWSAIAFNIYVYVNIHQKMKALGAPEEITSRLKFYPVVLVVAWGPDSIVFAIELFMKNHNIPALYAIAVFFASLEGLMNAAVYGLTADVKQKIKGCLCSKEEDSQARLVGSASTPRMDHVFADQTPQVGMHTPLAGVHYHASDEMEGNEFGARDTADL